MENNIYFGCFFFAAWSLRIALTPLAWGPDKRHTRSRDSMRVSFVTMGCTGLFSVSFLFCPGLARFPSPPVNRHCRCHNCIYVCKVVRYWRIALRPKYASALIPSRERASDLPRCCQPFLSLGAPTNNPITIADDAHRPPANNRDEATLVYNRNASSNVCCGASLGMFFAPKTIADECVRARGLRLRSRPTRSHGGIPPEDKKWETAGR